MKELNDDDILEYLMTSDFIENHNPEEYKYLLHKFRFFYKILYGNHTRIKGDLTFKCNQQEDIIQSLKDQLFLAQKNSADLKNEIDTKYKNRKLTLRERIFGKIV